MNNYLEDAIVVPIKRTLFPVSPSECTGPSFFGQIGWRGKFSKLEPDTTSQEPRWVVYSIKIIPLCLESRFWNDPASHFVMTVSEESNPLGACVKTWGNKEQLQNTLSAKFGDNFHLVVELIA